MTSPTPRVGYLRLSHIDGRGHIAKIHLLSDYQFLSFGLPKYETALFTMLS
jgi:hypothetical protein